MIVQMVKQKWIKSLPKTVDTGVVLHGKKMITDTRMEDIRFMTRMRYGRARGKVKDDYMFYTHFLIKCISQHLLPSCSFICKPTLLLFQGDNHTYNHDALKRRCAYFLAYFQDLKVALKNIRAQA